MIPLETVIYDPFDGPELAAVIGSIVTAVGVIVVGILANRTRQHAQAARHQVENDHKTNFRDDLDKFRAETRLSFQTLRDTQAETRNEVRLLRAGWQENRDDIDELLERTEGGTLRRSPWAEPVPLTRKEWRQQHE